MTILNLMVYRHSAFYSPILSAIAGGFLAHEGFEPTYAVMPPQRSVGEMLASGEIHVSQTAVSGSWAYLDKGESPPFMHFGQINQRDKVCNPTGLLTIAPDAVPFFRYLSITTETMEQCRHDIVQPPHPDSPWPGRHGTVAGSCCRGYDPQRALSHGRYGRSGPGCARPVRKAGLPKQ
jgi:hypothetical protein